MCSMLRVFAMEDFIVPSDEVPVRSVVVETAEAVVIVWHVAPGREIAAHLHPAGQDTWTVLSGSADYYLGAGETRAVGKGSIVVARPGEVHGALNTGSEPFVFVSVVSPGQAGYVLSSAEG